MRHVVLLMGVVVLGLASGPVAAGPAGAGAKTPEDVFETAYETYQKKGPKAFMAFLTKDSQKTLTGGVILTLHAARTYLSMYKETADHVKVLDELMKRQGLDAAKLKKAVEKNKGPRSAEEAIANMTALAEWTKDAPTLVGDVVDTINKLGQVSPIELVPAGAFIKDVKVTGETAKGTLKYGRGREEKLDPIFFRREGGEWRIDFLPVIRGSFEKDKK